MPTDAPRIKRRAIEHLCAEIVLAGTTSDERRTVARALQRERGYILVPPFDHQDIVCGQGTATLELLEAVSERSSGDERLDALFVPVGGGGLIAGACLACRGRDVEVHAVEPVGCDALAQSLQAGHRVDVDPAATLADGLKPVRPGDSITTRTCRRCPWMTESGGAYATV